MSDSRKNLDFGGLDDFQPRPKPAANPPAVHKAVDKVSSFPSRETDEDAQINIKASSTSIARFRAMAKAERYRHGEFLELLMDAYEKRETR
ncbi:hypothetical protein LJR030_002884 [Rhizobium sp. LjRoot30]|uniref:hypothetical protein n=1 Tax=Rhizobium sp. LjRoot30 TaxID=3342320 RepID=UPI003ED0C6E4